MDTIQRLAANESIRQAVARYCRGVDRLDVALMQSAYWPDAVDDHGVYVGDAMAFCERVVATHARYESTMHCIMNHAIEVDDDGLTAQGEVYNMTYLLRSSEDGATIVDHWMGRYLDRYECRGGEWRIAYRVCVHEWTRSSPIDQAMPIAAEKFRPGSADRGTGAPLGPG